MPAESLGEAVLLSDTFTVSDEMEQSSESDITARIVVSFKFSGSTIPCLSLDENFMLARRCKPPPVLPLLP